MARKGRVDRGVVLKRNAAVLHWFYIPIVVARSSK